MLSREAPEDYQELVGPIVVEDASSALLVPAGASARRDASGNIIVKLKKERVVGGAGAIGGVCNVRLTGSNKHGRYHLQMGANEQFPQDLQSVAIFCCHQDRLQSARKRGLISVNPCDTVFPPGEPLPRTRKKGSAKQRSLCDPEGQLETASGSRRGRRHHPATGPVDIGLHRSPRFGDYAAKHIIREAGVWAIDIQQSKNGRPRLVPIHRDLVRQGFLDFVRQRDGTPLFFAPEKLKDDYLVIHKIRSEGLAEWAREEACIRRARWRPTTDGAIDSRRSAAGSRWIERSDSIYPRPCLQDRG